MPDKWAQYAVPNAAAKPDKWAQYAQPDAQAATPPPQTGDLRAGDRRSFMDKLTEIQPDNKNASLGSRALNFVGNIGAAGMGLVRHPVDAVTNTIKSVIPGTNTPNPVQSLYQGLNTAPADTAASMIGQTAVTAGLGKLAPKPLEMVGAKMQDTGGGLMNEAVGSLQKDFKRGADPGRAYLDAGGKPALSMGSLASKAGKLKEGTGAKLGEAYDSATQNGVRIPSSKVSAAINPPIQNAKAVISGPGGTGNLAPVDNFEASFKPSLSAPDLSPNDVFGIKRNVAANTSWSDPTQFGMKKLQQQTTGALSGVLTDTLPETVPLNSQYQGLTNFANRANLRAQTGSMPLSSIARRAGEGAVGAALGATHSPVASALMGLGGTALESVPVKTGVASGLYYGGKGAVAIGKGLRSLYAPSVTRP